jgi:Domain of unknown function (DUF5666)
MNLRFLVRNRLWFGLLGVALSTALGCSMGGDSGGVGVGGTGNQNSEPVAGQPTPVTVNGPITGFGSVIVRGTVFDDRAASVLNDAGALSNGQLRLGMTVEIEGERSVDGLTATANKIRVFNELKGPAVLIDVANNLFEVLGSRVRVDANTVFDGAANLAGLKPGDTVVVYGYRNLVSGEIGATRVEVKFFSTTAAVVWVDLRGSVQALDSTARTFFLGGQAISYAASVSVSGLVESASVLVHGSVPVVGGVVTAATITLAPQNLLVEGRRMEFEGHVTEFVSKSVLKVAGYPVDASSTALSSSHVARLANGAKCEVEGKVVNAVVLVSELECESSSSTSTVREYEVSGTITVFSSIANFVARAQPIDASAATFSEGRASDLAIGKKVSVKGPIVGGVLRARTIEVD